LTSPPDAVNLVTLEITLKSIPTQIATAPSQRRQRQTFALADPLGSALVDFMGNFQLTHNEQLVHAIFMLKKR